MGGEFQSQIQAARAAIISARKHGLLQRQPCEVCGADQVDAHHDDYDRVFDIRWLCRRHHKQIHWSEARRRGQPT